MKTDSLFYQIFLRFPDSFFDLIGQPQPGAANYKFILNPLSNAQKTGFSEKPVFYSCK
ncbi:DUF2887 domain-containing protein [Microcystis aeruginosa]|uniref:DUF2887 domain-containing protein n=1 Tax=Microcystis aeruginosa TaxID=1126 RepID=UPI0009B6FCD7